MARYLGALLTIVLSVASVTTARAQQAPDGQADDAGQPAAQAADPAWQLYDRAFERLVANDVEGARAILTDLLGRFPSHPATNRAIRRLSELSSAPPPGKRTLAPPPVVDAPEPTPPVVTASSGEQPARLARGELAFNMTLHGIYFGWETCRALGCSGDRGEAAGFMLGGGLGLAASLYGTRGGITPGHAQLISSAVNWGMWTGLGVNDGFPDTKGEYAAQLALKVGGLGLGLGLWRTWRPTSGQVSLANTGGVWASILSLLAYGMADSEPTLRSTVIVGDLGIVLGALLSETMPNISRSRTLLIDAGGVVGLLAGGLVAVALDPDGNESEVFGALFLGAGGGLIASFYATRDWDAPDLGNASLSVVPMGQRGWGASLSLQLD